MQICLDSRMSTDEAVVALGMFDGVHIGHHVLMQKARAVAKRLSVPLVVQTFTDHPLRLIDPSRCPPLLTTPEERVQLMEAEGVDLYCALPFTPSVRDMAPEVFVGELVRRWHPKAVVAGFNYTFGAEGAGTPVLLRALGNALGFQTYVVPAIRHQGVTVSATVIRERLERGDARAARFLLGRPYTRAMQVTGREGATVILRAKPDGKVTLPEGLYRAVLTTAGRQHPVLATAVANGDTLCRLPERAEVGAEATLCYLTAWQRDDGL